MPSFAIVPIDDDLDASIQLFLNALKVKDYTEPTTTEAGAILDAQARELTWKFPISYSAAMRCCVALHPELAAEHLREASNFSRAASYSNEIKAALKDVEAVEAGA